MGTGSRKLIATDESTVLAKSFFYPLVVKDSESDRSFPNPPRTNEGDRFKAFSESDNFLNQFIAPKTVPRRRGR